MSLLSNDAQVNYTKLLTIYKIKHGIRHRGVVTIVSIWRGEVQFNSEVYSIISALKFYNHLKFVEQHTNLYRQKKTIPEQRLSRKFLLLFHLKMEERQYTLWSYGSSPIRLSVMP